MSQPAIPALIAGELAQVEAIIQERIASQATVAEAAKPWTDLPPERRVRAMLTLLTARLGSQLDTRVLHAAAAAELIATATNLHAQLIDDAERRRGQVADHNRWRGDISLMLGDYVFALAASEMALAPDQRIMSYFSDAVTAISESELSPVATVSPTAEAIEQYRASVGGKTAVLFAAACKVGMVCGGGSPAQIEALGRFGHQFGLVQQIITDCATLETDLRAGRITLPFIYAVEITGDEWLSHLIDADQPSANDISRALAMINTAGGITHATADAQQAAQQAARELDAFPPSEAKDALLSLLRDA